MSGEYTAHLSVMPSELEEFKGKGKHRIKESYDYCLDLFKLHAKSFYFASKYLDDEKRRSFAALYGFCRLADDFVDEVDLSKGRILEELDILKDVVTDLSHGKKFDHPLFLAFGDTLSKYHIPVRYMHELIDGVRMDVNLTEIETEEELSNYCYHVASTVGLMMCHIWERTDEETLARAADLGHALQLTNILRDIAEDYDNGRIYLARETRDLFRVTRDDFDMRTIGPEFRLLIKHEIARARALYAKAEVGVMDLPPAAAFTVKVASRVYSNIMVEIEKMDYQVFKKRAVVPKWKKIWIAFRLSSEYRSEQKEYESRIHEMKLAAIQ